MMPLSEAEKRQRKVDRIAARYRALLLSNCVADVAKTFQKLVRLRAVERDGMLTCVSCGKRDYPGNHFDAGHWIGRTKQATIFDDRNCHPQCHSCNRFAIGPVKQNYDRFMEERYGRHVMDDLLALSKQPRNFTREELAELKQRFLDELREVDVAERIR